MMFAFDNNPISRLDCFLHNKMEDLSRVHWLMGKRKEVECRICGDKLNNLKDMYSPKQCGWKKIGKYTYVCHRCLDHRNFIPFIEMIDEAERKEWEENHKKQENIRLKAQEIIELLKEYLPEYKDTLNLYNPIVDLDCFDAGGHLTETDFSFIIEDEKEQYVLDIRNSCILKVIVENPDKLIEVANYLDEEVAKQCTNENPWTWDDAIEVIKKRLEDRINGSN